MNQFRVLFIVLVLLSTLAPMSKTANAKGPDKLGLDGRTIPPGGTRVGNQVIYYNGAVVLELAPSTEQVNQLSGTPCPSGWFCLFEHRDWRGRMLKFRDPYYWQYLSNWGFANQASSWHNRLVGRDVLVVDLRTGVLLWCADSGSKSSFVGWSRNDKADAIYIGRSNYC